MSAARFAARLVPAADAAGEGPDFEALSPAPWLKFEPRPPSGWLRITYRLSLYDRPVRPIFSFRLRGREAGFRLGAGPALGRGETILRFPEEADALWVSPAARQGRFGFAIEAIEPLSALELLRLGLAGDRARLRSALALSAIGWRPEAELNLLFALAHRSLSDWPRLRESLAAPADIKSFERPRADWRAGPAIRLFAPGADEAERAALRENLGAQLYPRWSLEAFPPAEEAGDLFGALAPGDRLAPHALACFVEAFAQAPEAVAAYCDEDHGAAPGLKPDFSPLLEAARPYVGRLLLVRGAHARARLEGAVPGDPARFAAATLAGLGRAEVLHLPRPLIETQAPADAPALKRHPIRLNRSDRQDDAQVFETGAISCRPDGSVRSESAPGQAPGEAPAPAPAEAPAFTSVPAQARAGGRVAVVVPTRDRADLLRRALDSLKTHAGAGFDLVLVDNGSADPAALALLSGYASRPDARVLDAPGPFNFSKLCNLGAAAAPAQADVLLFLNNDVEILAPGFLDALAGPAGRPGVGAVGGLLLYPDGRAQHAGLALGMGEAAGHFEAGLAGDAPGWLGRNLVLHEVSAVTGACLAVSRARFDDAGGFDAANLPIEFNDLDLCLRLAERGLTNLLAPAAKARHFESASRGRATFRRLSAHARERDYFLNRWRDRLRDDPFFHPAFSLYSMAPRLA